MNRQIKELAEQANIKHDEHNDVYYNDSYDGIRRVWLEKFAELIVRECMTVARGADGLDATHEAWYLIEQHFGIGMSTEDKKTLIKELLGVKND
jgi:hypothetical protein